ncbi:conserved hypothetical protein [Ricinus communis]|uniref:Uncharacterized protein n=1 Tax=Ricinus communis TaxID=3988 RepID=B9SCE8_RICCO|nr:conserved hypothetical protein [Ricinus communis]
MAEETNNRETQIALKYQDSSEDPPPPSPAATSSTQRFTPKFGSFNLEEASTQEKESGFLQSVILKDKQQEAAVQGVGEEIE